MRRAANENPVVQAALIGILVLVFAIILYTRILAGGSSTTSSEPAATTPATSATGVAPATGTAAPPAAPSATGSTATAPATAPEAAPTAPVPQSAGAVPGSFEAGKGLPAAVVNAYDDGKTVVLLVAKQSGIDDRAVKGWVEALSARPDLAVFVTGAKHVARYSRITLGVDVSQVPALVVIRPKRLSGNVPEATVSYGFRSLQSITQAIDDAVDDGKDIPYYP